MTETAAPTLTEVTTLAGTAHANPLYPPDAPLIRVGVCGRLAPVTVAIHSSPAAQGGSRRRARVPAAGEARRSGQVQHWRASAASASRSADAVRADVADGADNAVPCPECELPAEVMDRFALGSTDGPVDHVAVACPAGHYFRMAVDRLSAKAQEQPVEPDSSRQRAGGSAPPLGGSGACRPPAQLCPEEGGADAAARR
jgi:hypothetical protein